MNTLKLFTNKKKEPYNKNIYNINFTDIDDENIKIKKVPTFDCRIFKDNLAIDNIKLVKINSLDTTDTLTEIKKISKNSNTQNMLNDITFHSNNSVININKNILKMNSHDINNNTKTYYKRNT